MELRFYNSLTKKKEVFNKDIDKTVTMYTCGPTVYNYAHIGNFRAYIFEDILKRALLLRGYKVKHVMNITDIEDKIIKAILEQNKSLNEYTQYYTEAFLEDIDALNIIRADVYPKATEHIDEIVQLVKEIENRGIAYKGEDGSIYFSIKKYNKYGKLQNIDFEQLKEGVRIDQDEYTKDFFGDFALWKSYDKNDGDVYWETEFGKGRPGWHIECSVMCMKHLSDAFKNNKLNTEQFETVDIHCGGIDNLFPHHENEIAQTESVTSTPFVRFWMHCEHLNVEGKKMSKSLGNFYTLRQLIEMGYSAREIRYVLIASHYKQKLNFSFDGLKGARSALKRIDNFVDTLKEKVSDIDCRCSYVDEMVEGFKEAVFDDLNISKALSFVFGLIKRVNKENEISETCYKNIVKALKQFDSVLGVIFFREQKGQDISDEEVEALILKRDEYKKNRQYQLADEIRDSLKKSGIEVQDSKKGTTWRRI